MKIFLYLLRFSGHLIFVGGMAIAAIDWGLRYFSPHSGTWQGVLFLGITAILGFPWTLVLFYALAAIAPLMGPLPDQSSVANTIYLILHSSGIFINYGIFLWITKKMKAGLKVNVA